MAKKKTPDKDLTTKDLADMSVEDVLDELLFDSHYISVNGPLCRCMTSKLTHFMGMIPDKLCGVCLEDIDISIVPDFETKVSSLCPCQRAHYFNLRLEGEELKYETTEGKVMDPRRLRLPNF